MIVSKHFYSRFLGLFKQRGICVLEVVDPVVIGGICCADTNTANFVETNELGVYFVANVVDNVAQLFFRNFNLCVIEVVEVWLE